MDNNTPGSRKLFLKPAKSGFQSTKSENGNSGSVFNLGNNPFLKKFEDEDAPKNEPVQDPSKSNDLKDDLFKPAKKNLNLFTNASTLSNNSFVFGQNLHERVVIDKNNSSSVESTTSKSDDKSSNLLFSSALSTEAVNSDTLDQKEGTTEPVNKKEDDKEKDESSSNDNSSLSLVEAARRYEEMKGAQKRKYEEVEVKTGEEDEKNILEMNCKLFTFDKNNWEERGRGMLRLNDDSKDSSRVVFRASGSFRVLLNTTVWKDQLCEQPSSKSLRLTAFDTNGLLKIYLVMGKNEDIENLYHFLSARIQRAKLQKDKTPEPDEDESSSTQDTVDDTDLRELPTKKFAASE